MGEVARSKASKASVAIDLKISVEVCIHQERLAQMPLGCETLLHDEIEDADAASPCMCNKRTVILQRRVRGLRACCSLVSDLKECGKMGGDF